MTSIKERTLTHAIVSSADLFTTAQVGEEHGTENFEFIASEFFSIFLQGKNPDIAWRKMEPAVRQRYIDQFMILLQNSVSVTLEERALPTNLEIFEGKFERLFDFLMTSEEEMFYAQTTR